MAAAMYLQSYLMEATTIHSTQPQKMYLINNDVWANTTPRTHESKSKSIYPIDKRLTSSTLLDFDFQAFLKELRKTQRGKQSREIRRVEGAMRGQREGVQLREIAMLTRGRSVVHARYTLRV